MTTLAGLLLCLVRLACVPAAEAATTTYAPRKTLTVRTYSVATLGPRDLAEARRVAGAILRVSGIDIRWKDCGGGADAVVRAGCRDQLAADEVVMRLTDAPERMPAGWASLGFTAIDLHGGRNVLSTVYLDRVRIVAARARIEDSLLAGRAMAHELGHLLLGTQGHASQGLMRAVWSDLSLRSRSLDEWTLSPSEVAAIRDSAATPLATAGGG